MLYISNNTITSRLIDHGISVIDIQLIVDSVSVMLRDVIELSRLRLKWSSNLNGEVVQLPVYGGKSPIGILNKVGPFQEILKIVTNLFIFDRSCQKTITLLVSYKR